MPTDYKQSFAIQSKDFAVKPPADKNEEHIIASYSLKTKQLLIKNANSHIPQSEVLKEFVEICERKGEWK